MLHLWEGLLGLWSHRVKKKTGLSFCAGERGGKGSFVDRSMRGEGLYQLFFWSGEGGVDWGIFFLGKKRTCYLAT